MERKHTLRSVARCLFVLTAVAHVYALAQPHAALPDYKPTVALPEVTLRAWGSDDMEPLLKSWEAEFARYQPGARFTSTLKGSHTTQAGLYQGIADLGLSGREAWPLEKYGLFRKTHHFATEIAVAGGSYNIPSKTFALAVFLNKDNPLKQLTMDQLDGIFGHERTGGWNYDLTWTADHARGAEGNLRTWGQLGLTGEWADKPIHVYGLPTAQPGLGYFFQQEVFHGGDIWNSSMEEMGTTKEVTDALANDKYGIGYSGLCYGNPGVKSIALAAGSTANFVPPTRENVQMQTYPLSRRIYIYIDRAPGDPVDPKVKEFLRYVLSKQGQQKVAAGGIYLPLSEQLAAAELHKLD